VSGFPHGPLFLVVLPTDNLGRKSLCSIIGRGVLYIQKTNRCLSSSFAFYWPMITKRGENAPAN